VTISADSRGDRASLPDIPATVGAGHGMVLPPAVIASLTDIASHAAALVPGSVAAVWLADEDARGLRVGAVAGASAGSLALATLAFGQGGVGCVAAGRASVSVDNVFGDSRFVGHDWWRSHGMTSFLGVPILLEHRILGVVALNAPAPVRLSVTGRDTLDTLVTRAAEILDGAWQQTDAARQREELLASRIALGERLRESAGLLAIARVVGTSTDLTEALRLVCRQLANLSGADTVAAYLLDAGRVRPVAGYHVPKDLQAALATAAATAEELGFSEALFELHRPVWTDDAAHDARFVNSVFTRFPHRSALVLPLVVDEAASGGFYLVWWERRAEFDAESIETLEAISGQVGVLLGNSRLRETLSVRASRLRELVRVNQMLSSSLDMEQVLTAIARAARQLSGAPVASFWLVDVATRTLTLRAVSDATPREFPVRTLPSEGTRLGWIASEGRVLDIPDIVADSRFVVPDWFAKHGLLSFYGLPIVLDGAPVAVLALNGRQPFRFDADERELLDSFGRQAAIAIRNASLFEAGRRAEALRAVALLATAAADEINNPLAVIVGHAQLLERTADAAARKHIEPIVSAAHRISEIVARMRRITTLEETSETGSAMLDIRRSSAPLSDVARTTPSGADLSG
jgi:GAF domain-containing protein